LSTLRLSTKAQQHFVKQLLRRAGVLPWARRARSVLRRVLFLPRNLRYWRGPQEDLPIPPLGLIDLVSGQPDISWYLEGGRRAASSIEEALSRQGVELRALGAVLDLGCGCGRVVRHWSGLLDEVYGCDIHPELVAWCRRNLQFGRFEVNELSPPLPYPAASFGLVYALSVFTHLPESLQLLWVQEVWRVLSPGSFFVLTTHGERYLSCLDAEESVTFADGRLVVRESGHAGGNAYGAFHPPEWVRSRVSRLFRVCDFVPEGATGNPYQDLWVLRKSAMSRPIS